MSPAEHYFENLLFGFVERNEIIKDLTNTQYLSEETERAVRDCAIYVICDCCDWDPEKVDKLLHQ